mgnify:CR=1 FL=1
MSKDDFDDRMKLYEMSEAGRKLMPILPALARIIQGSQDARPTPFFNHYFFSSNKLKKVAAVTDTF